MATGQEQVFSELNVLASLPSMFLIAWIAARLLGVRNRSWLSALIAGSTGWGLGASLAVAVSRGRLENLNPALPALFAVLSTMVVLVAFDLLSNRTPSPRPLLSVPRPLRAVRTAWRRARRYLHVVRIATRHGLGPYLGLHGDPETAAATAASARAAMEEAGGVFVKLGQLLAGRADLLPAQARREFARLHERAAPADPEAIQRLVESELGAPVSDLFETFEAEPIAAASIAQAHAARLPGGDDVVVKVQRPAIDIVVADDLAVLRWLARTIQRRTAWGRTYRVTLLADEFAAALSEELDFRIEARNLRESALALSDQEGVVVPTVFDTLSTRRVLVLERLTGSALADAGTTMLPNDARKLADALLRGIVAPMMAGERFHADPHPGNIRLLPDGRIGLLDFGATGRLDTFEQTSVIDILLAVRGRDPTLLLEAVRQVTDLPSDVDERQLEHALARFLARHITPTAAPDANMLTELLRVFLSFGIALPAGTTSMFRALVTLQGSLELLCPHYPVIDAAQQLAGDLLTHRVTTQTFAEAAQQELVQAAPMLRRLPRYVDHIATQLQRGELRVQTRIFGDERDARLVSRLVGDVVLVLAAATAGGISVGLLDLRGGPNVTSGVTLYQAFGYVGLTLSLVLLLRVVVAVLRGDR